MSLDWSSVKALAIPVGGVSRDVKSVSVGGTVLWAKPNPVPYDAEVEYLTGGSGAYINTGINIVPGIGFECAVRKGKGSDARHIGNIGNWGVNTFLFYGDGNPAAMRVAEHQKYLNKVFNDFTVCSFSGSTFRVDSLSVTVGTPVNGPGVLIFDSRAEKTSSLSYVKLYTSGVLVRDYIPVRVGSGANAVGCLYDRLGTGGQNPDGSARNDGLYFNQGTGAFVIGPDKAT
jgi:hypothetical protein